MVKKLPFCKMKNLECFTMTAGFGNSAKFEDPNLERQADDRLAPFNEITRETVEWTKGTIARVTARSKMRMTHCSERKKSNKNFRNFFFGFKNFFFDFKNLFSISIFFRF